MNNKNIIVFEKVNSNVLIYIFFKFYLKKKNKKIYYIYSTSKLSKLIIKIYRYFGFEFIKLKFRMIDIRNENGEIYSLIIQNKELFDFEKSYLICSHLLIAIRVLQFPRLCVSTIEMAEPDIKCFNWYIDNDDDR